MNLQEGIFWLILTVFLEGRDQPVKGQKNIAKIILNRAEKKQWPLEDVIFARKQFSCYNKGLMTAFQSVVTEYRYIKAVTKSVQDALDEWHEGDNLNGATHYFNPKLVAGGWPSTWDKKKMRVISREEDHVFLIEI
jgi:spore germination cell wall hydrolase CwlJ-like protein